MNDYKPKPFLVQRIQENIVLLREIIGVLELSPSEDIKMDRMISERTQTSIELFGEIEDLLP